MPDLPLTSGLYGRPRLDLPPIRLLNAYAEDSKGGPSKRVRTTRPGLTATLSIGTGPILRGYQQPGAFNGDPFHVSGGALYKGSDLLGDVAYSQHPRMASAQQQLMLVSGGGLYCYQNGALTPITTFDDGYSALPALSGVSVLYNIFIYPVVGSNQFYFSNTGDGTTINAANVSAAQTSPTPIVNSAVLGEELYFFKAANGVEIWDFTGNLTAPFAESQGRTYARGLAAQDLWVQADNAIFWVGDDFTVYRTGTVPTRVSEPYEEDRIKVASANSGLDQATMFTFGMEGHVFIGINLPSLGDQGETYVYDVQSKEWASWGTLYGTRTDPGVFIGNTCTGQGGSIYIGSRLDGTVWQPDPANPTDDGTAIQRVIAGAIWMQGGVQRCNNISLQCVRGVGTSSTPNPVVQMRYSDDGGNAWSSWDAATLGPIGGYRFKATWWGLGLMEQPGREFEFKCADPVNFTVESASYNEARP